MSTNNARRYNEKANDSFRTKLKLYLFHLAINENEYVVDLNDFKSFEITEELVKVYTTIFWQYEIDYIFKPGLTNDQIYKKMANLETLNKETIERARQEYIRIDFTARFSKEEFEALIKAEQCAYCGISIPEVVELANKQQLFKKNYRGWTLEVDRKNSNFEYSATNCVMACYWCNNAKTDEFTHEEFIEVGKTIRKIWDERKNRL
jgi:5-methylcytosine-specific restriction endonuclease McrA